MTAPLLADRVAEIWTGTGTGIVTPGGALTGGYRTWGGAFAEDDEVRYVIAHRGLAEYEVGVGTIGAGGTLARTTVVESSNAGALVNFSAGEKDVFCAIDAASLMGIGITRMNVQLTTGLLAIGDVYEAAVTDFGRLFRLLKFTVNRGAWIRLYGSAADRTADVRTDPTVAVTTEAVLAEAVLYDVDLTADAPAGVHGIGVFMDNSESPQLGRLFVRITRLDELGTVTPYDPTIGTEFGNVGAGDQDLNAHAPTQPGSSGLTGFEYAGADDAWLVAGSIQGYPGAYKGADRGTFAPARTGVDLVNGNLRIECDIRRLGPNYPGMAGVCWCLNDDVVGSWALEEFLYVILRDETGDRYHLAQLWHVDSGGTHTLIEEQDEVFGIEEQEERRFVVEVVDGTPDQLVTVWLADAGTGANPVLVLGPVAIPDYRASNRQRIGIINQSVTEHYTHTVLAVWVNDLTDTGAQNTVQLQALGDRLAA